MMSFRDPNILCSSLPINIVRLISSIDEYRGKQQLYIRQSPQALKTLQQVAMVQSTESSNRIEGITVPTGKIQEIMADKVQPSNRSEGEVAGYRDILAIIHSSYEGIRVTPNVILQLHRDLYSYIPSEGGIWKPFDNTIDDVQPDGTHTVRFRPVSAIDTPGAMDELCRCLDRTLESEECIPLLAIAAFILDFLCIHPFRDGNGRMSRLLSLLLLYRSGYEVGRYISLERIVEQTKETYYESLAISGDRWHEGRHNILPWCEYFLGFVLSAYREFESRVGMIATERGSKSRLIRSTVLHLLGDFSVSDIMQKCPSVSKDLVRSVLDTMKQDGDVICLGTGRSARWRRIER